MAITIIGTGNVATVLGKKLVANGFIINQIFGRNLDAAIKLAQELQALPINNLQQLATTDIYIICVSDKAIAQVAKELNVHNKIVLHTAGSVNSNILQQCTQNFGVLYPIQSLRKSMDTTVEIPFLIDANNNETLKVVEHIARSISSKVDFGNDEKRLNLHTAAVFACNFVNFMYLQSAQFCQSHNINFSLLQPLIVETAHRLHNHQPKEVFTGPAIRKDFETINKHLHQLKSNTVAHNIYQYLTQLMIEEYDNRE